MVDKIAAFRKEAADKRKHGTGARYGAAMKKFALAHAVARMSAGASVQAVAAELGLTGQTLSSWLRTATKASERPATLMPVTLKQGIRETSRAPIVIIAGEVRIEVADVETATDLARRLQ